MSKARSIATSFALVTSLVACGPVTADRVDVPAISPGGTDGEGGTGTSRGSTVVLTGATITGAGPATLVVQDGVVQMVLAPEAGASLLGAGAEVVDLTGHYLAPAFIDSHVHLAYTWHSAEAVAAGGVAAAVDHAAPVSFFEASHAPLQVLGAGPMVAAVDGYPTQSWGSDGYGIECVDGDAAAAAVADLHGLGAELIKVSLGAGPDLTPEALAGVVDTAHDLGLRVSAHALGDTSALAAAAAGADTLAHTPTVAMSPETLAAWGDRAVISTLKAFGGSSNAVANLAALREAGATVLYGTDLGNTSVPGIDGGEIALLMEAGLDGAAILEAGTTAPAAFWGFDDLGSLAPGRAASFLVLDADPLEDPMVLADPVAVYIDGVAL